MSDNVIIYDNSQGMYWGEDQRGYVCAELAGVYTRAEAKRISEGCKGYRRLEFFPVPADHIPTLKAAKAAAEKLLSCILSVRRDNTASWMYGIANDINTFAAATGEADRVRFDGDRLIVKIEAAKLRQEAGE